MTDPEEESIPSVVPLPPGSYRAIGGGAVLDTTYTTTMDDYIEVNRLLLAANDRKWCVACAVLAPFLGLLVGYLCMVSRGSLPESVAAGVLASLALAAVPWVLMPLRNSAAMRTARGIGEEIEQSGNIGTIRLILGEESFAEITRAGRSDVRWGVTHAVVEHGPYLLICVTERLLGILPRHGFDREEDFDAARDFILGRAAAFGLPVRVESGRRGTEG